MPSGEITEALYLINLRPHYYRVQRFEPDPSFFGARVTGATYDNGRLSLQTNRGDIEVVDIGEFALFASGVVCVFRELGDDHAVLGLTTSSIDDDFVDELKNANARLGRSGRRWAGGLKART